MPGRARRCAEREGTVAAALDFFFFYGSIHSYLSAMRIEALAASADVAVSWRPFNLRQILIEQNNTGFTKNETKMNYFWHDVERRARRHGVPFAGRAPYPADPDLLALRVGLIAAAEGWCAAYSRATFHAWFIERRAPGVRDHTERVLASLGRPTASIIARAKGETGELLLGQATDAARSRGIFGAPTFAIGTEIYWGDDRLEEALAFAASHRGD
jgi:2-hydroxychromene-2-carboxylate isomerase